MIDHVNLEVNSGDAAQPQHGSTAMGPWQLFRSMSALGFVNVLAGRGAVPTMIGGPGAKRGQYHIRRQWDQDFCGEHAEWMRKHAVPEPSLADIHRKITSWPRFHDLAKSTLSYWLEKVKAGSTSSKGRRTALPPDLYTIHRLAGGVAWQSGGRY